MALKEYTIIGAFAAFLFVVCFKTTMFLGDLLGSFVY